MIPKHHAEKLHQLPAEEMADVGPCIVKVAKAIGAEDYNILQNNGKIAHQVLLQNPSHSVWCRALASHWLSSLGLIPSILVNNLNLTPWYYKSELIFFSLGCSSCALSHYPQTQ